MDESGILKKPYFWLDSMSFLHDIGENPDSLPTTVGCRAVFAWQALNAVDVVGRPAGRLWRHACALADRCPGAEPLTR